MKKKLLLTSVTLLSAVLGCNTVTPYVRLVVV